MIFWGFAVLSTAIIKETLIKSLRTANRMGSLQCMKLHQAARSAWGLGRSPILKLKEALKDTLRLMLLDRFQQLLKINQRFLKVCRRQAGAQGTRTLLPAIIA